MAALATGLMWTLVLAQPTHPRYPVALPRPKNSVAVANLWNRHTAWKCILQAPKSSKRRGSMIVASATASGEEEAPGRTPAVTITEEISDYNEESNGEEEEHFKSGVEDLKRDLVNTLYGIQWGSNSRETHAEICDLLTQLEAVNPNPASTEALELLNGRWILV